MKHLALLLLTVLTLSSCSRDNDSKKPTDNKVYSFTDNPAIIGKWINIVQENGYSWVIIYDSQGNFIDRYYKKENPNKDFLQTGTYTYKKGFLKRTFNDSIEGENKEKLSVGIKTEIKGDTLRQFLGSDNIYEFVRVK
ncbi:MAG: hypothetical protein FDW93_06380 [Bergeyella sp.]|nr:hypothetical protein [Bergeyella sp.]